VNTYAVIDVGSNSVKLYVAARSADQKWHDLTDCHEITRLAAGVHQTGLIEPAAQDCTVATIGAFADQARALGAERIVAVGTMGLRMARNADQFTARVKADCGVEIEVISGQDEARFSFLAVQAGLGPFPGQVTVFDIGGGSTEITWGRDGDIQLRKSIPVGAVRLTEQFLVSDPVTPHELASMLSAISLDLGDLGEDIRTADLVGVGGTVTNLSAVQHGFPRLEPQLIQGTCLVRNEIETMIETFRARTIAQRKQIVGLEPKRADVILAGAGIAEVIMQKLHMQRLTVSARGLRHGVMADRFA
jgi:exopolyphosphatase/guanosine-5'-triphosphate,3'-diphosphate pyrophosphatase